MSRPLALRSRRVATPEGIAPATVRLDGETIREVAPYDAADPDARDLGDLVLMPGVVDSHVHVNEPGRTEWEGFETATRAALAGGTTTIVDMPLNSDPVTTTVAALEAKRRATEGRLHVDVALWGGVVPGNAGELAALVEHGVSGMKCFLVHSGIDEFPNVSEDDLARAMPILARRGATLLVHAEMPGPIDDAAARAAERNPRAYATYLWSRPAAAEDRAIELVIRLASRFDCRAHVVHLSSAGALPAIAEAKRRGVPITVETCPHYLSFAAEEIQDGDTRFKCAPPIRERENRERLWEALREGVIDQIVSDHSPCAPELKRLGEGDFLRAWGGIASVQYALPATWTAARRRGVALERVIEWMCRAPARLAGLERKKGAIAAGMDADLVAFDPDGAVDSDPSGCRHRHKLTPYAGQSLFGAVRARWLRGREVDETARGELI